MTARAELGRKEQLPLNRGHVDPYAGANNEEFDPINFYLGGVISADFPGEACGYPELTYRGPRDSSRSVHRIPAKAEIIYGITQQGNAIFSFDSATPGTLLSFQPVTGFLSGPFGIDSIGSIDIRPSNGKLYGVSANGRIYTVDPLTGIATVASTIRSAQPLPPSLFPNVGGFDFDPVSDSLRVVSPSTSNGPNLRVNIDTGDAVIEGPVHFDPGNIKGMLSRLVLLMQTTRMGPPLLRSML